MLAQIKSLVGSINYNGIFCKTIFFQIIEYIPYTFINSSNRTQIILHITLISPLHKIFFATCFYSSF